MIRTSGVSAVCFTALLIWGVLTLWIEARWAWAVLQTGIFVLAGWRVFTGPPRPPWATLPLLAAALWPAVQLVCRTTVYPGGTAVATLDWEVFLLAFVLADDLLGDARNRRLFLLAASLLGLAIAAASTIGDYACPGKVFCLVDSGFPSGVMGPFVNRNQCCAWIELLLPAALYLAWVEPRFRALFGTAAAIMAGSVVASGSRAGVALTLGEIPLVILALAIRKAVPKRRLLVGAGQFAALAALVIAIAGWQNVWGRWRQAAPEDLRKDALRASVAMVWDRPWTGSGLGTWSRVYPGYAMIDRGRFMNQAHNDWAQWSAEGGLPFFFFLFFFATLSWKPAFRSIYGIGTVVFLLHALVDYPMQQRPALAAWFFCMAGLAHARRHGHSPKT